MNHERRKPGGSIRLKAAALAAAAAAAGLAAVWTLADSAAPPRADGAVVGRAAPASPPSVGPLLELQEATAIPLDLPAAVGVADIQPDAGESGTRRRPIPGTERAYREAFVVALRKPGVDVDALLDKVIPGHGPDAEKVALLRALLDIRSPKALDALVTAAEKAEAHDGPASAGVPEFCVRMLVERAARDADARAALGRLVASHGGALEPRLRRTAAAQLAFTGTSAELALLAAEIRGSDDPELLLGVARSLEWNPEAPLVRCCFTGLPVVATDGEPQGLARN